MPIRVKIVLVVLPLLIVTLILAGALSFFFASTGITKIAKEFLGFKAYELEKYAESQWALLVENNYTDNPDMVAATQAGVITFAKSLIRSDTERIIAIDENGRVAMQTEPISPLPEEQPVLRSFYEDRPEEMLNFELSGLQRVGRGFFFEPYSWFFLVTEERETFYRDVNNITQQTIYLIVGAVIISIILILLFSRYLTNPLKKVIETMKDIISSNNLSERVNVEYHDETGQLAHTFNIMVGELEKAYNQIKHYAFEAVLAQKKESKIRNIFQKYVPQELIDRFFKNPESMLVGDNRVLSILFSDIRSFTTISESLMPDDLVNSLNRYFSVMVDIIVNRQGIVDKYIGDAIMAFFGAPVKHEDDALQSVLAGIEMSEAVKEFNKNQIEMGKPEFKIGVGINYGIVTVGNIGTEKKMDYTVIGDMVNLASRLEGLTKPYKQELLISESLYLKVKDSLPTRLIDSVAVKGKTKGGKIYTAKKQLSDAEKQAWDLHNKGMELYYKRRFVEAVDCFREVGNLLPGDFISDMLMKRCQDYQTNPPPEKWDGVEVMKTK